MSRSLTPLSLRAGVFVFRYHCFKRVTVNLKARIDQWCFRYFFVNYYTIFLALISAKGRLIMRNLNKYFCIFSTVSFLIVTLSCSTGYNKHADQYFEEGLAFYKSMEYDLSIESFNKTLELAPYGKDNNIVYYNRGMAHLKNRQNDKAIYDFTKALEMTPASSKTLNYDIFVNRGEAYQKSDDFDHAVLDYTKAIELLPKHKNIKFVYSNRAWVQYAKGNYDEAAADFSEAIKVDPEFERAFYGRATVWFKKEDNQRALSDAKEAVRLNPADKKYDDLLYEIKAAINKN